MRYSPDSRSAGISERGEADIGDLDLGRRQRLDQQGRRLEVDRLEAGGFVEMPGEFRLLKQDRRPIRDRHDVGEPDLGSSGSGAAWSWILSGDARFAR